MVKRGSLYCSWDPDVTRALGQSGRQDCICSSQNCVRVGGPVGVSIYISIEPPGEGGGTHSLRTPNTRLSMKKDPIMIIGTKKIQLNSMPTASFV